MKLTVVLDYYKAMGTYSRIGLLRSYRNLQSYWTTTKLCKPTFSISRFSTKMALTETADVTRETDREIKKTTKNLERNLMDVVRDVKTLKNSKTTVLIFAVDVKPTRNLYSTPQSKFVFCILTMY